MSEAAAGLADAASPFLRHGAEQPVAWLPWGEEAFERARAQDRPILLDIGAVWCHWCHVMDRESYEDRDTAALINELFVPVKVDRDERPDVDARYQRAVQALAGQGGWPLTAFLTPDGEVFYGGTYFPPEERHGRPSFRRVLREVARVWADERDRASQAARSVRDRLGRYGEAEAESGPVTGALVDTAVEELAEAFEFRYGGFGQAPKFPNAGALLLLLDRYVDTGHDWVGRMVVETLDGMGRGGIHDQLGGGFHRYSTDVRWLIPHFEKMAYDNGPLLEAYARAGAALDRDFYRDVARGIVGYYRDIAPELVEAGGFPASQDADVGDDDGDYWTWTEAELRAALGGDERRVRIARARYGFEDPDGRMHSDRERHVLFRAEDAAALAAREDMAIDEMEQALADIERRLAAARRERPRPFVDETLYTGWVAMVASGHLAAARHLELDGAGGAALRALERLWDQAYAPGRGVVRRVGDDGSGRYLDDQVHLARAMLDAFEYTQDRRWLERAETLMAVTLDRFRRPELDGLTDRPADLEAEVAALDRPHRTITDSPEPAANAVAALVLARLFALGHREEHRTAAESLLAAFAGSAKRFSTAAATFFRATAWITAPVTTIVIVEGAERRLLDAALRPYRPRTVVRRFDPDAVEPGTLPPALRSMVTGAAPRAYLCTGQTCAAPVSEPDALRALVESGPAGPERERA